MPEKLVPDLEEFFQRLVEESRLDLPTQRNIIVEKLMNFPPDRIAEIPYEAWYRTYWKLVDFFQYFPESPEQKESISRQILNYAAALNNPVKNQFAAFALLLFGKFQEASALMNQALWTNKMREDYATFAKFNRLINGGGHNLRELAEIDRRQRLREIMAKKYSYLIEKYRQFPVNDYTCPPVAPENYNIWYCWLQGKENLIPLAQICYNSLKMNAGSYKIRFIDDNNFSAYLDLPAHVIKKYREGKISRTHFSDILRINLLERYGGLWMDATVLVTDSLDNHKNFWQMPYYTQKYFMERSNEGYLGRSTFQGLFHDFLQGTAILHNPLFAFVRDCFNDYLQEADTFFDYLFMDFCIYAAYENIPFVRQEMDAVPLNNINILALLYKLNEPYAAFPYDKITGDTFFFKMVYKLPLDMQRSGTVFKELQRRYAPETIGKF